MKYPERISEIKEFILRGYHQGYLHRLFKELISGTYPRISLEDILGGYLLDVSAGRIRWTYPYVVDKLG